MANNNNTPAVEEKKDTIEISKSELAALLSRMDALEANEKKVAKPTKKVVERQVKLRHIDGKIVLGISKVIAKKDEYGEKKSFAILDLEGGKTEEVKYVDFLSDNQNIATAVIISEKKDEVTTSHGYTDRINELNGYPTGEKVELVVTTIKKEFNVKIIDGDESLIGKEITVSDSAVNI